MKPSLGDLILTKDCSKEVPLIIGEEGCLLGTSAPFSVVSKTEILIIAFDIKMFFAVIKYLDAKSL